MLNNQVQVATWWYHGRYVDVRQAQTLRKTISEPQTGIKSSTGNQKVAGSISFQSHRSFWERPHIVRDITMIPHMHFVCNVRLKHVCS